MRCDLFANRTGDDVYRVASLLKVSDPIVTVQTMAESLKDS